MAIEKLVNGIKKGVGGLALGTALVLGSYGVSGCVEKPELTYELCEESCSHRIDKCSGESWHNYSYEECIDDCFDKIDCDEEGCHSDLDDYNWHKCISEMVSCYDDLGYCQCVSMGYCNGDHGHDFEFSCPSDSECKEIHEEYDN